MRRVLPLLAIVTVLALLLWPRPAPLSAPYASESPIAYRTQIGAPPSLRKEAVQPTLTPGSTPGVGVPLPTGGIGQPASYCRQFCDTPEPRVVVSKGSGVAKWYPRTRGYGDLATVALPDGHYIPAGQPVPYAVVCVFVDEAARCLTLPVVDCLCKRANQNQIVDLSLGAVAKFGLDPSTGVWPASVERLGGKP